ncbi:MAG: hypothetical protein ACXVY5_06420 [Gaiellales bacterium]
MRRSFGIGGPYTTGRIEAPSDGSSILPPVHSHSTTTPLTERTGASCTTAPERAVWCDWWPTVARVPLDPSDGRDPTPLAGWSVTTRTRAG